MKIQRTKPKEEDNGGLNISLPPQPSNNRTANYQLYSEDKKDCLHTQACHQQPEPHRIITRAEYDQLISHPRFTPVHRLILDEKLKRGEWLIET